MSKFSVFILNTAVFFALIQVGVHFGKQKQQEEIEHLFGMSYAKLIEQVEVCKALADDDTECHLIMKPVEFGPIHERDVSSRRDRFCKEQGMEEKLPSQELLKRVTR